ncbi:MAG: CCA tRNA nucleotidyltransferase [Planctomycetes bacterium]|nr:CCA tRNA nucleotidyltransferase [Planctomycetota bacterium]
MLELPNIPAVALARRVIRTLREAGHEALLAGGCVRDLLLKREPKDYDVATSALPDQVEALFTRTVAVGKAFGVIKVLDDNIDGFDIEVATFRHDGPYLDGRHPSSVQFTNAAEDAARRDFTINALFLDPDSGAVLDHVGGLADLDARVIRAVGDPRVRFKEDKLRLLRAVRFAAGLNFDINDATLEAVSDMAGEIKVVSAERIQAELTKLLTARGQSRGFKLMLETGLLDAILPEISVMVGVQQPPEFHPEGDVWTHTMLALDLMDYPVTITLALGVLLHDVAKPPTYDDSTDRIRFNGHDKLGAEMAGAILRRLKFPNDVIERVQSLIEDHLKFINVPKMKTATLKRFVRKPHFDEDLELHRIDCLAGPGTLETYKFVRSKLAEFQREPEKLKPRLPIDGNDLKDLGLSPGPQYKELLAAVEDEILEGRIETREQAIAFVKQQAKPS